MPPEDRPLAGRRALLAAALGVGVSGLSGCGIRLEDDAPRVPLVPARTPVPGEDLLVALTRDCARLADLAAAAPGPVAARLVVLHRRQETVLRTALLGDGVPEASFGPEPGGSASPTPPSPAPTASSDAADPSTSPDRSDPTGPGAVLARAEADAATGAGRFATVGPALRAPVAALHAQRFAAARLLGVDAPAPEPAQVGSEVADDAAAEVAGALYLVEVAAARASASDRARAGTTRSVLLDLRAEVLSGQDLDPRPVGHPLPFPVRSAADARRLGRRALTDLRADLGTHLATLVAEDGAAGLRAATRWLGTVELEAHRWGLELAPFPGLR